MYPAISIKQIQLVLTFSYNTQSVSIPIWRSCISQYVLNRYNSGWLSAIILILYQSRYGALVSRNMYRTDTTRIQLVLTFSYNTQSCNNLDITLLYPAICIVQIQLGYNLCWLSAIILSLYQSRYDTLVSFNMYRTDTTQSQTQGSSIICILHSVLVHETKNLV